MYDLRDQVSVRLWSMESLHPGPLPDVHEEEDETGAPNSGRRSGEPLGGAATRTMVRFEYLVVFSDATTAANRAESSTP